MTGIGGGVLFREGEPLAMWLLHQALTAQTPYIHITHTAYTQCHVSEYISLLSACSGHEQYSLSGGAAVTKHVVAAITWASDILY